VFRIYAGSSSLKIQLIETDGAAIATASDRRLARGQIERIGGEAIVTLTAGEHVATDEELLIVRDTWEVVTTANTRSSQSAQFTAGDSELDLAWNDVG